MKFIAAVTIFFFSLCCSAFGDEVQIGGTPAEWAQFPYFVRIFIIEEGSAKSICGGCLIDEQWVLTSAFCLTNATDENFVMLLLGAIEDNENAFRVFSNEYYAHLEYEAKSQVNNIALIKLEEPIVPNDYMQRAILPICFNDSDEALAEHNKNYELYMTGYNDETKKSDENSRLVYLNVNPETRDSCSINNENMICVVNKEKQILGDMATVGAPLILKSLYNNIIIGIGAFVNSDTGSTVFTSVVHYLDWIGEVAGFDYSADVYTSN